VEIHGNITQNLTAAVDSSRRLRGHPVHKDTLQFWADLLQLVRSRRAAGEGLNQAETMQAIAELEAVVAQAGKWELVQGR
jgi:hypothetical protein